MGCNHSKEATAVVVEVDDAHLRRRSRAKLKLDVAYHAQQYQYRQDQPLKLPVRCSSDSANDKPTPQPPSLTRTPAVTPHAAEESYSPVLSTTEYGSAISRKADEVCASDRLDFTNGAHVANSRYREPAACRGSTAELSNSEGSGEDHAGRERESEGEGKRVGEGKGGMATAAAGVAREAFLGDRSGAGENTRHTGTSPREAPNQRAPPPPKAPAVRVATLPPEPPVPIELRLFLENHRPQSQVLQNGNATVDASSHVRFSDGLTYEGQLRRCDGMPHGWGRVTLPDGVTYEGNWFGGRVHGKGALRLSNGNAYWGSWAYGRKHGLGTFLWADNSRYDGYYRAGERSGVGTLQYATGAMFEGEFDGDMRHGAGRLELSDGASYDGQWCRDVPHGHGVFVDAGEGGERFEGSWHNGMRSGGGRLVQGWAEEEEGTSARCGRGASGLGGTAWYSGNFEGGFPHGDGTMGYGPATFCGHVEQGVWTGGGGRVDLGDGTGSFEGAWCDGLPTGSGRWRYKQSGVEADCSFKEGYSKLIWPS